MTPVFVGFLGLAVLFALVAVGLPIAIAMSLVGIVGVWYFLGGAPTTVTMASIPFRNVCNLDFGVLPLFLLMAEVCASTEIVRDLYNLAAKWLGRLRGGLSMATVGACAGFAAASASSIATASTMGLVAVPEMKRYNYQPALATGCVAAGGTMGVLIPPSTILVFYAILTETSIGKLFIAGIVPGVLEALFYIITIYILCLWKPELGPRGPKSSLREKVAAFGSCGEIIGLIILVLGGLLVGWFTPTEAGAVGAFGAILFSMIRKRLSWKGFVRAGIGAMRTTGMIFLILIGAMFIVPFMALSTIPAWISHSLSVLAIPPLAVLACIVVMYIFLGAIMDVATMMALTIPIFFPVVVDLGIDPIWFGILVVRCMEVGMITPPIGMNVYVIAGVVPDVPMSTIFKGILPFLIADVFHISLLFFVPAVVLFLPGLM